MEEGLARRIRFRGSNWLRMHPEITAVYLCALAEQVAIRERLHPVTDQPGAHAALSGWTVDRVAQVLLWDRPPRALPGGALDRFVLITESPVGYLFRVERELSTRTLLGQVRRALGPLIG